MREMAELKYRDGFHGTYEVGGQTLKIGMDAIRPYDMTYGAVASCMWATYLDVTKKKEVSVQGADVSISGFKRKAIPATLERVVIHVTVYSKEPLEKLQECMDLAIKYCSMVQTVAKVAAIEYDIQKNEEEPHA